MAYRKRLLNNDANDVRTIPAEISEEYVEEIPSNPQKSCFDDNELDEKIAKYTNNLNQIKYGRQ